MLSRLADGAAEAEVHAFEAIDRCCAEAHRDYWCACACADADLYRRGALRAAIAGDLEAAVSLARREGAADASRRAAWTVYREAFALLLALVQETAEEVVHVTHDLAVAG